MTAVDDPLAVGDGTAVGSRGACGGSMRGTIVADLYIDSQALADFSGQIRGLLTDFSSPIAPPGGVCDGSLLDAVISLSSTDRDCGSSLNNYLTALAGFTDQAAQAAERLDADLAKQVPSHAHGSSMRETW